MPGETLWPQARVALDGKDYQSLHYVKWVCHRTHHRETGDACTDLPGERSESSRSPTLLGRAAPGRSSHVPPETDAGRGPRHEVPLCPQLGGLRTLAPEMRAYQYHLTIWNEKASYGPLRGVEGLDAALNDRGAEGWDLVAVTQRPNGDHWYHFKREVGSGRRPRGNFYRSG